jgi:hypothetical protein
MMAWKKGRGLLGPLQPLLGDWRTLRSEGGTAASNMACSRCFTPFGKWVRLEARWETGPDKAYCETAFFGAGEDGTLAFFSFTNDGKSSMGRLADGSDVHPDAIAFEAQMPAGLARFVYWPAEDGGPGFLFAVENRTKKGWNRFLRQHFGPAD